MMNNTVRENILFGKPFCKDRYNEIIKACALVQDFEMLPSGDESIVGPRGINLSGGQKQRIALARAIYSDADIYLLDDPLSAVDSQVGNHIFKNAIGPKSLLRGKTRILVTHGLQWALLSNRVAIIHEGIVEIGSFQEIQLKFSPFLRVFLKINQGICLVNKK